jgi:hypothetical protein
MTALALQAEETARREMPEAVSDPARTAPATAGMRDAAGTRDTGLDALNPYKAAQSYGPIDGDLFFGRDAEGVALARFLIGKPVSILSAPSGIGKTSLLQAKVLPLLEQEHWHTVLARPREDAIESLIASFAEHLLPDPAVEVAVIGRLAAEAGEHRALRDALEWFLALPGNERIKRRLYVPAGHPDAAALPMICRALRGSFDLIDLLEHFEAVACFGKPLDLTPRTTLRELTARLGQAETATSWRRWRARFGSAGTLDTLAAIFEQEWAPLRPSMIGAVMVLDQFEEVFTLKKPGTIEALFERIGGFLERSASRRVAKPMHLMFSLRKEFYADLVPHVRKFGADEQLTCSLGAMPLAEARHAFTKPAAMIGLTFAPAGGGEPACIDGILGMALDEGTAERKPGEQLPEGPRYSPAFISLIGAHLGERLRENPDLAMPLTWREFQRLIPQLDNVFGSFLEGALAKLESMKLVHRTTRFDALELLDKLATSGGFRNIIAEDSLIEQLPMKRDAAEELLNVLDFDLKLVRREGRRKAIFVEIMHERLIAPIRRLLAEARRRDVMRASLAIAYDMLHTLPDDPDPTKDPLPAQFREALWLSLDHIDLDGLAARNLMRSLLIAGPGADWRSKVERGAMSAWSAAICSLSQNLSRPQAASSHRAVLLVGRELKVAIDNLDGQSQPIDLDQLRHIAISALADRSEFASESIRCVFRKLSLMESSP